MSKSTDSAAPPVPPCRRHRQMLTGFHINVYARAAGDDDDVGSACASCLYDEECPPDQCPLQSLMNMASVRTTEWFLATFRVGGCGKFTPQGESCEPRAESREQRATS